MYIGTDIRRQMITINWTLEKNWEDRCCECERFASSSLAGGEKKRDLKTYGPSDDNKSISSIEDVNGINGSKMVRHKNAGRIHGNLVVCYLVIFTSFVSAQLHFEVPREKLTASEYGAPLLSPGVVFLVVIIALLGVVMVYNIFITVRVMCHST